MYLSLDPIEPKYDLDAVSLIITNFQKMLKNSIGDMEGFNKAYENLKNALKGMGISNEDIAILLDWETIYSRVVKKANDAPKSLNSELQMFPQDLTSYHEMTSEQKDFITQYINGFRITAKTGKADIEKMEKYIKEFVDSLGDNTKLQDAINNFFSLDNATLKASEIKAQKEKLLESILDNFDKDTFYNDEQQINFELNLQAEIDNIDQLKNDIASKLPQIQIKGEYELRNAFVLNGELADELSANLLISDLELLNDHYEKLDITAADTYDTIIEKLEAYKELLAGPVITNQNLLNAALERFQNAQSDTEREFADSEISKAIQAWREELESIGNVELRETGIKEFEAALLSVEETTNAVAEAIKEEKIQKLQSAAISDIKAAADGRVEEMSALAKQAVAGLGDASEVTATELKGAAVAAYEAAGGFACIKAAVDDEGVDISGIMNVADAIMNAYGSIADKITGLSVSYDNLDKSSRGASRAVNELTEALNDQKKALEDQKSIYDSALRAISDSFDKEIKKLQQSNGLLKERQTLLNTQLSASDSSINYIIDREIKALRAEQDAIDKQINSLREKHDLQQKLYELHRSQEQRNQQVFVNGQIKWQNDAKDVRQKQHEIDLLNLQTSKKAIQSEINVWNDYKDQFNDFIAAYNYGIDLKTANDLYGFNMEKALLSDREAFFSSFKNKYLSTQAELNNISAEIEANDNRITEYSRLKEIWQSTTAVLENEANAQNAALLLGENWEKEILNNRTGLWEDFRDHYLDIQDEITRKTEEISAAMEKTAARAEASAHRILEAKNSIATDSNINKAVSGVGSSQTRYTKYADGTAHANGSWGATESGPALTGELGQEIVVRGDKWFTVGDHGAELVDIKKGDIVFNHQQSEEILKHGHVTGRGKAYAGGKANAGGDIYHYFAKKFNKDVEKIKADMESGLGRLFYSPANISEQFSAMFKPPGHINHAIVNKSENVTYEFNNNFTVNEVEDGRSFVDSIRNVFPNMVEQAITSRARWNNN